MATPIPEELPPNFRFGSYVVRACVGRGAMAHVYRCDHLTLSRTVALKVVDRWVLEHPTGSGRFLEEARSAAAIKHPNVVNIIDVGTWSERPYIVMEFLEGRDLDRELDERGALPDAEVAALALPVVSGLIAVHDAGVIHRDVKPSNIFLWQGPEGEIVPKLLDFGISQYGDAPEESVEASTSSSSEGREIVGTPTYMAPEALEGGYPVGPHSDQYSLGAVLYECAVGRPPFLGDTVHEILDAIAVREVDAPRSVRPEISVALERVITRAMHVDPEARFASLRDLGRALWPLADERTRTIYARSFGPQLPTLPPPPPRRTSDFPLVIPMPPDPSEQTFAPPRKRRRRWPALAAALAVALLSLPWWYDSGPGVPESDATSRPPVTTAAPAARRESATDDGTSDRARDARPGAEQATDDGEAGKRQPLRRTTTRAPNALVQRVRAALRPQVNPPASVQRQPPPDRPPPARTTNRAADDPDLADLFSLAPDTRGSEATAGELGESFSDGDAPPVGANASPLLD